MRRECIPDIELARLAFWVVEGPSIQIVVFHVDARKDRIRNVDEERNGKHHAKQSSSRLESRENCCDESNVGCTVTKEYIPTMRLCELRCLEGSEWEV